MSEESWRILSMNGAFNNKQIRVETGKLNSNRREIKPRTEFFKQYRIPVLRKKVEE